MKKYVSLTLVLALLASLLIGCGASSSTAMKNEAAIEMPQAAPMEPMYEEMGMAQDSSLTTNASGESSAIPENRKWIITVDMSAETEDLDTMMAALDEKINAVAQGWKTNRMGRVDLCLIRLALYEILYDEQVPVKVAINEAVELAKIYGADDDHSYVNGVLGAISRA